MKFSVHCLAFYFELNNHKTDTQNKNCKTKIFIEETVIIWLTFKPGLELTGFQPTQHCFEQFYRHEPAIQSKTNTWSVVNFNKTHDLDEL